MRQAGILAAAGIVAIEKMSLRLSEDHARAKKLADGLKKIPFLEVDEPATNMVFLSVNESIQSSISEIATLLKRRGVLVGVTGNRRMRMVCHYWIDDQGVDQTIDAFQLIMG